MNTETTLFMLAGLMFSSIFVMHSTIQKVEDIPPLYFHYTFLRALPGIISFIFPIFTSIKAFGPNWIWILLGYIGTQIAGLILTTLGSLIIHGKKVNGTRLIISMILSFLFGVLLVVANYKDYLN